MVRSRRRVLLGKRRAEEEPCDASVWNKRKRTRSSTPRWDELPSELLAKVLQFLPPFEDVGRLAVVCKRWHSVLSNDFFWRSSFERWFNGAVLGPTFRAGFQLAAREMRSIEAENADPVAALFHTWFWAAQRGHDAVMIRLLYGHPHVITVNMQNAESRSALYIACMEGHTAVVEMLLEAGAMVDVTRFNGATPLHSACWNGHCDIVHRLLEANANVNATHNTGSNGLHSSSWKGHLDVVEALIAAGADVNAPRQDGVRPLHEACWKGEVGVVEALLDAGADLDAVRDDGMTALCAASQQGHEEVVKILLERGANVQVGNRDGITPLHAACLGGSLKVVRMLLEAGGDPTALATVADEAHNVFGRTPAMLAESRMHTDIVRFLEQHPAPRRAW